MNYNLAPPVPMVYNMLNIVVALPSEAKPLIDRWQLKKICHLALPFAIFVNQTKTIHLIVAGVGKVKAAMAVTFLHVWTGRASAASFLNVGIAGSATFPLGACVLVNKIVDAVTERCWYPYTALLKTFPQGVLMTHDIPQKDYPLNGMVDMEGAGFFQAAAAYVTQEHIHSVKIISDNDAASLQTLNSDRVKKLVAEQLPAIVSIVDYQLTLSATVEKLTRQPEMLDDFRSQWHFTHAEIGQLKEYLRRWFIQLKQENPLAYCQDEKNAAQVIYKLMTRLDHHANSLY